jgi:hypothetical protein
MKAEEKRKDIEKLAAWCELVIRFLHEKYRSTPDELESALSGTCAGRQEVNLRGLRMVCRDLNEDIRDLPESLRSELDEVLVARFGHGIERGKQTLERQARKILRAGKIRKADEYRILESWLETMLSDPSKSAEIERINALLMSVTAPLPE